MPSSTRTDLDPRTDGGLIAAASTSPEAFGVFYNRHFKNLTAYYLARTFDRDISFDLASETFAVALANLDRYDPSRGEPAQWLYGIAGNQLKQFFRKQKLSRKARRKLQIRTPTTPTGGWEAIETADARLDRNRLAAALQRVPAKNREAVRLRVIAELSYEQIAEQLDCTPSAASNRVMRGLRQFSHHFEAGTP